MATVTQLKHIGLSDKEAKVYLAMLELGPATVLEIAAKAGVNRPTTYVEIESLKKKGLASSQTRGTKQLFMAESPDQLKFLLEREVKHVEQKKEELTSVLPDLMTLFNLGEEKPQVRFFEGKEGLTRMQENFLKAKQKIILGISSIDDVFRLFPNHPELYTARRINKKIHTKLIYTSRKGAFLKKDDARMIRESKFVPPEKLPFNADVTIYDENVAIAALKGRIAGVIITQKEIADSFRGLFDLIWKTADRLS